MRRNDWRKIGYRIIPDAPAEFSPIAPHRRKATMNAPLCVECLRVGAGIRWRSELRFDALSIKLTECSANSLCKRIICLSFLILFYLAERDPASQDDE